VFVCDNLAFGADLLVRRKHTVNGAARFSSDIAHAVMSLATFKESESRRIAMLHDNDLTDAEAESFMLRACVQKGIVAQRQLPDVFKEWHEPSYEAFQPRTAWSLLNSFTHVLRDLQTKNPSELAHRTMRLQALLCPDLERCEETFVPSLAI
jgi:GDP-D-mannose dehydratase